MISARRGRYELDTEGGGAPKQGEWTYTENDASSGTLFAGQQAVGDFSYRPISGSDVFADVFKWEEELNPSRRMSCISVAEGEVMAQIQRPESEGAYFVLPARLNGAQYPQADDGSIVGSMKDYIADNTGGPRAQLAVHPAAGQFLLDNARNSHRQNGLCAADQLLQDVNAFSETNGYLKMPSCEEGAQDQARALFGQLASSLHTLRPLIMHGVEACGLLPHKRDFSAAAHRVGLVYASAVPVDAPPNEARNATERKLHQKVAEAMLVAQYYGALQQVAERVQSEKGGCERTRIYLLPLGVGALNNPWQSIARAMSQAVELMVRHHPQLFNLLHVQALAWSGSLDEKRVLRARLEQHGKLHDAGLERYQVCHSSAEAWSKAVLDLVADADSRARIGEFLATPMAKRIIEEWVVAENKPDLCMTDMSDVYKPSMMGAFARIQSWYDRRFGPGSFAVRFSLNVRKSSELRLEEIFVKASLDKSPRWAEIRDTWLRRVFTLNNRRFDMRVLRELGQALPLPLKGVIRISEDALNEFEQNPQATRVSLHCYLKPKSLPRKHWLEIVMTEGSRDFLVRSPDGAEVTMREAMQHLEAEGFDIVCDAEGPWHLVTLFETSLMQETAASLGQGMQLLRGWSDEKFYSACLQQLDQRMRTLREEITVENPFDVFLFAGRRSTHPGFHLLQNLWCTYGMGGCYKGTSSLFAYRVFHDYGWIKGDGTPAGEAQGMKAMPMVGTHAHEGSMVFQAIASEADDKCEYPVSSLLWHLNYWALTGNQALLPDTIGTPAFKHLLNCLQFPPEFVTLWNERHGPNKQMKGGIPIAEELRNPLIGGLVRQDSGSVSAFTSKYFPPAIRLKIEEGKPVWVDASTGVPSQGYKCLASEISSDQDVREARALGFLGMGTGGYFGEKPWKVAGDKGPGDVPLNHRVDLVAKVSAVKLPDSTEKFHPVKVGDYEEFGKWHMERSGKFAISPEVDDAGREAEQKRIFQRARRQGQVGEAGQSLSNLGNCVGNLMMEAQKPKWFDTEEGQRERQRLFNEWWVNFCFVG